jgi:hypothetical protein
MVERQPPRSATATAAVSELGGRFGHVRRLRAFLALADLELHLCVLGQRFVALADDRAVVDEQVLPAVVGR